MGDRAGEHTHAAVEGRLSAKLGCVGSHRQKRLLTNAYLDSGQHRNDAKVQKWVARIDALEWVKTRLPWGRMRRRQWPLAYLLQ